MSMSKQLNIIILISWFTCAVTLNTVKPLKPSSCNLEELLQCPENETCRQNAKSPKEGICDCKHKFVRRDTDGVCVRTTKEPTTVPPPEQKPIPSANSAPQETYKGGIWILASCITIAVIIIALLVAVQRYRLLDRLYDLRVRRYNTVLVSSLNDDDAPIQ